MKILWFIIHLFIGQSDASTIVHNVPSPTSFHPGPRIALIKKLTVLKATVSPSPTPNYIFPIATLLQNGTNATRINFIFIPDGYQASEQTKFSNDAQAVLTQLFQVAPYSIYKNFFNAYAIQVPSVQSGASHPHTAPDCPSLTTQPIAKVNNFFGSTFDGQNIHREIEANTTLVDSVVVQNFPGYNKAPYNYLPIVLVNTPYYGGLAEGAIAIISSDGSTQTANILEHELGHSLGGLGDEYAYSGCGGIEEWNATTNDTATIRWSALLTPGVAIPTSSSITDNTVVGAFLGANYCPTTWYRPSPNCMMRTLGTPFCSVCMERMVFAMNYYTQLIDGANPPAGAVNVPQNQAQIFNPNLLYTAPNNFIGETWLLDGKQVSLATTYTLPVGTVLGKHTLTLNVHDNNPAIKSPNAQTKVSSLTWNLNVVTAIALPSPTSTPTTTPTPTAAPTATPLPSPIATPKPSIAPSMTPTPTMAPSPTPSPVSKPVMSGSVNGVSQNAVLSGQVQFSISGSDSLYNLTFIQLVYTDVNGVHNDAYLQPYNSKSQMQGIYFQSTRYPNGNGFLNVKVIDSQGNTFSSTKIPVILEN